LPNDELPVDEPALKAAITMVVTLTPEPLLALYERIFLPPVNSSSDRESIAPPDHRPLHPAVVGIPR
jgi:hypothetical protein